MNLVRASARVPAIEPDSIRVSGGVPAVDPLLVQAADVFAGESLANGKIRLHWLTT
jgi:hypothetical protein